MEIAVIFSLLSVWFTFRNNILCWPIGIFGIICFSYLFYQAQEWSNFNLQFIFLAQSVVGWVQWSNDDRRISKVKGRLIYFILPFLLLFTYLFAIYFNSSNPILDSITTTFSIFGMFLLAYKKIEAWYFWIIADLTYIGFFIIDKLYLSSIIYLVFLIMAINGLVNWNKKYDMV